ncbi:general transcription factor II-I repeat domain-containing protein 2-like [Anomaloglossus baeobatrachus]|uniref:general transcription factor II-I repeat domain-containing protein 2-like n=1 Tax=Anomaloglossus baeobatrachus TaxID=238106 RepID=UPI003F503149
MASAMSSKKRKIAEEKRIFQDKWEQLYFVTEVGAKVQCLICFQFIAVLKDYNVRRHYMTHHGEQYEALSGKLRDEKVQQLKASLKKQRNLFSSINKASESSVKASFVLSNMIAKYSRPFTEGQFIKDCFVKASEILCPDKTKLFEGISLSANTVASRITESASNIHQQLITAAQSFEAFSIALDESTGVTDTAYCAVFIRGVDENVNIIEEFLDLLPMKGTTTGRDIFKELEDCINTAGLPWDKLVSVVTDGAPAMCSENIGVVGLLKAKRNQISLSGPFSAIHCILHQEALCGKSVQLKEVMDFVVKTVNFIRARGLNHRQFTSFLSDMDTEYGDLLYHTEVRWLSRGRVLKRFFSLREEIALFMALKDNDVFQLSDPAFLSDLAFLTDVTEHLNELNLKLQGQKHIITIMFDSVKAFKCKLSLWAKQLQSGNLAHFSAMQSLDLETEFALFATPFAVDVSCVSEDLQMELVDLQCDTVLKQKYMDIGVPDFYKFVSQEKFPKLVKAAARIMAMFGSTYVCEQFFSSMKLNKSALRSRLTDEHLRATLRLATAHDFKPQVDLLVSGKRSQLSSQTGVCHT